MFYFYNKICWERVIMGPNTGMQTSLKFIQQWLLITFEDILADAIFVLIFLLQDKKNWV